MNHSVPYMSKSARAETDLKCNEFTVVFPSRDRGKHTSVRERSTAKMCQKIKAIKELEFAL